MNPFKTTTLAMLTLLALPALAAACGCGPDFCTDDGRIAALLAAKEKDLGKQYPKRLVALLHRGPQCVARIEREPDAFTLVLVSSDGSLQTQTWSKDDEELAQKQLGTGDLKRYWVVNGRRAFSCCDEPNYDKMDDYDSVDDVNASRAIKCVKGTEC